MKKAEKCAINLLCEEAYNKAMEEYNNYLDCRGLPLWFEEKRLYHCSAYYFETKNYIFLKSYNTIIAFINKNERIAYDMLRYVYGYTATSAQHFAKFCKYFEIENDRVFRWQEV